MWSPAQTQHFETYEHRQWGVSSYRPRMGRWPATLGIITTEWRWLALISQGLSAPDHLGAVAHLWFMVSVLDQHPVAGLTPMIGVDELSALIDVPVTTIYDWRTHGEGPVAHRFGKHLRFTVPDVEAWIASRRETPAVGLRIPHPHTTSSDGASSLDRSQGDCRRAEQGPHRRKPNTDDANSSLDAGYSMGLPFPHAQQSPRRAAADSSDITAQRGGVS